MDARNVTERTTDGTDDRELISAHRSSPDRVVFTEAENREGWIAFDADAAVSIEP